MGAKLIAAADVAKTLGISEDELKKLSKELLIWRKDFKMFPARGVHYTEDAVDALRNTRATLGEAFDVKEDEVVWGVALDRQPPNHRFVWLAVPGVDGQCLAAVPMRLSTRYRVPGKRIPLTHIEDNLYQIAQIV